MPEPRLAPLRARRVVADPAALDGARWPAPDGDALVILRIAPDEAVAIGAAEPAGLADPDAIDEPEAGLVGCWLSTAQLERIVVPHLEWRLPALPARPALAQGKVAGVPAKLWLAEPGDPRGAALLVAMRAHAADLAERLGVDR